MADFLATPVSTLTGTIDVLDNTGAVVNTTTNPAHDKVNDSNDATFVYNNTGGGANAYLVIGMTTDMVNPTSVDTVNVVIRANFFGTAAGTGNDSHDFYIQIRKSDGVTPLTNEQIFGSDQNGADPLPPNTLDQRSRALTVLSSVPADWSNAQIWFHWAYDKVQGPDDARIRVSEIVLTGTYTGAPSAVTLAPESIAAESYAQPARILQPNYWSNVVGGSFLTPAVVAAADIASAAYVQPVTLPSTGVRLTVDSIAAASHAQPARILQPNYWSNVVGGSFTTLAGEVTLTVNSIAAASSVDPVSLAQQHSLVAASIAAASSVDPVSLAQQHELVAESLAAASSVDPVSISSEHRLAVDAVAAGSHADAASITVYEVATIQVTVEPSGVVRLTVASVAAASHVDSVSVGSEHNLTAASIAAASHIDPVSVGSQHSLVATSVAVVPHIDSVAISSQHSLVATSIAAQPHVDPVAVRSEGDLAVSSIAAESYVDAVAVAHVQRLAPATIAAQSSVDAVDVIQAKYLAASPIAADGHAQTVSLQSWHLISVEDIRAGPHLDPVEVVSGLKINSIAASSYAQSVIVQVQEPALPPGYKPSVHDITERLAATDRDGRLVILDKTDILLVRAQF